MRPADVLAGALLCALASACSSSSAGPTDGGLVDARKDTGRPSDARDAGESTPHDAFVAPHDAIADRSVSTIDVVTGSDAFLIFPDSSPYDAFTLPEAAIPHDSGGGDGSGLPPCATLPDDSFYCAPVGDAGSSGYFTCMQGNGVYSACAPGTTCAALDAGGVACEMP